MKSDWQWQSVAHRLNSILNIIGMCSPEQLWKSALKDPVPLFKTVYDQTLAIFNDEGFFLSEEAEKKYKHIRSKPHIYVARLESGDAYYIGSSNQQGGRFKRNPAYHLGGLACEILEKKDKNKQDHSKWVQEWFKCSTRALNSCKTCHAFYHTVRLKEKVIISFFSSEKEEFKKYLKNYEVILQLWAWGNGFTMLNKEVRLDIDK
ncbi:MAG: hypothetical protein ACUVWN_15335 [bacterium]